MNRFESFASLLAQTPPNAEAESAFQIGSLEVIIIASLSVGIGLLGLVVGFAIGSKYGKMSGELRVLKSIKTSKRSSRSKSDVDSDSKDLV